MPLEYTTELNVDLSGKSEPPQVALKQGDVNGRILLVTLLNNGQPYAIPTGTTARVGMTKPDGEQILNDATITSGKVKVILTQQMLTVAGDAQLDIQLYNSSNNVLLSSANIYLRIYPMANKQTVVDSSAEYKAFQNGLLRLDTALEEAEIATDDAEQAATSANAAASAANTATSKANTAATNANAATSRANTAASAANTATTNANAATTAANNAADLANAAAEAVAETDVGDLAIRVGKTTFDKTGDLNNITESGWYTVVSNQSTNRPGISGPYPDVVQEYHIEKDSGTANVQLYYTTHGNPTVFIRNKSRASSSWSTWKRIPVGISINSVEIKGANYTSAALKLADAFPVGTIISGLWTTAPDGFLLLQGQAVSRTTYAALFAFLGTKYGSGNGSTTFNVPDFRGRVPAGYKAGDANFGTLGEYIGETTQGLQAHIGSQNQLNYTLGWDTKIPSAPGIVNGRLLTANNVYYGSLESSEATRVARDVDDADPSLIQPTVIVNYAIKT